MKKNSVFNICDFGAVGDGKTLCTEAIKKAAEACRENGGGRIVIPSGEYLSGSIRLYSNTNLHIEAGATLRSTAVPEDHPYIGFMHNEMGETTSFIWAMGEENITVDGCGTVDLNARRIYPEDHPRYYGADEALLSEEQRSHATFQKNEDRVNQPIFFESCKNLSVKGISIVDSPCWTVTFSRSSNITVDGLTVNNNLNYQNNDGIHFSGSSDGVVSNCKITCADDCIALTNITARDRQNSRITVSNCILSSRSAAVRLSGRTEDVAISNLVIHNTNRAFTVFAADGGFIRQVSVSNVVLHTKIYGGVWWGKGEALVICAAEKGCIDGLMMSGVSGTCENGIALFGYDNVTNIKLTDIALSVVPSGNFDLFGRCIDCRPFLFEKGAEKPFDLFVKNVKKPDTCRVFIDGREM